MVPDPIRCVRIEGQRDMRLCRLKVVRVDCRSGSREVEQVPQWGSRLKAQALSRWGEHPKGECRRLVVVLGLWECLVDSMGEVVRPRG